jgi:hypothetical protein
VSAGVGAEALCPDAALDLPLIPTRRLHLIARVSSDVFVLPILSIRSVGRCLTC